MDDLAVRLKASRALESDGLAKLFGIDKNENEHNPENEKKSFVGSPDVDIVDWNTVLESLQVHDWIFNRNFPGLTCVNAERKTTSNSKERGALR